MHNAIIKSLDLVLLLLANFGLRFDGVPELQYIVLDLLHVEGPGDSVSASHFFHISLSLAYVLSYHLGVDNVTARGNLSVGCGRECY